MYIRHVMRQNLLGQCICSGRDLTRSDPAGHDNAAFADANAFNLKDISSTTESR